MILLFLFQVDNFVDCEDDVSDDDNDDDDNEKDEKKLNSFLEDDVISSNYSPSVLSFPNCSNSKGDGSSHRDLQHKVDLNDENHKTAKEICYLSGAQTFCYLKNVWHGFFFCYKVQFCYVSLRRLFVAPGA